MSNEFKKQGLKRITILAFVIAFLFSLDAFRVFYISTVKGAEYSAKAESQQLSDTEIAAKRGSIYDSDGNVLAQSATTWDIFLDSKNITDSSRDKLVNVITKLMIT